jgi:predicted enzyme related to lactoylglutathione lyase
MGMLRAMTSPIAHLAINADDVDRSLRFYGALFGWEFEPFGPPGFFRMARESGPIVALQQRRDLGGVRLTGVECTVEVEDLGAVAEAVVANGGRIVMERATIANVGDLIFFEDPSGIVAGAIQYARD